jgi:hypothetical protein
MAVKSYKVHAPGCTFLTENNRSILLLKNKFCTQKNFIILDPGKALKFFLLNLEEKTFCLVEKTKGF